MANYLVVGGSHGIGAAISRQLAGAGHDVHVVSRQSEGIDSHPSITHHVLDVTEADDPTSSLAGLPNTIDGVAYCPGSINLGPLRGVKTEAMAAEFELNVVGAVRIIQAILPRMKAAEQSSIVMFSTVAVQQGLPMHSVVASVKGAVEGLTRSLAAEMAPAIRVNCIAPSLTDTPLASRLLSTDEKRSPWGSDNPLGRVGMPEDIASMATFLLDDQSTWITDRSLQSTAA